MDNNNDIKLLDQFNEKVKPVSSQEQKEFDAMNIDFNNLEGKELTVEEVINY